MDIAWKIVNVVATAALDQFVDLKSLVRLFPQIVIYDPATYPPPVPAYFKSKDMQGKVSIFSSGKMISVGTKSGEEAGQELILVANKLKTAKVAELKTEPKIQNIIATADLGFKPDIERLAISREVKVIYEPEQFPGAIIRLTLSEKSKATVLLFSSGKIVCVGLKDRKDVNGAIHRLLEIIS